MKKIFTSRVLGPVMLLLSFFLPGKSGLAQCDPPTKKTVLLDPAGRYFLYWKPSQVPIPQTFDVQLMCVNNPPCSFSAIVNKDTALRMNGGWLGIQIPALPNLNSVVKTSILPEECEPELTFTPLNILDVITDDLDYTVATCDSDTCIISTTKFKTLQSLTDYYNTVCGGGGGAVPGSTVTSISGEPRVTLKRNSNGKWQLKPLEPVVCDSCYIFIFQVTCTDGTIHYVQDSVCFNYTGPPVQCRMENDWIRHAAISIAPNPVEHTAYLELTLPQTAVVSVSIYNSLGRLQETMMKNEKTEAGAVELLLPVDGLESGWYHVEVMIDGVPHRLKLMKF